MPELFLYITVSDDFYVCTCNDREQHPEKPPASDQTD